MQSSTWISPENSNFWSNRKRKTSPNDLEEKSRHKMFITEELLIKNMRTLSLELVVDTDSQEDKNDTETKNFETRFEYHNLLKDNLRRHDLEDSLINKLCDLERKKLCLQIVPYMPIHPSQLTNNNNLIMDRKEEKNEKKISSTIVTKEITKENDDHLFKIPFLPTPYTVEEPCENSIKRTPRMKRSYSQSIRSNSNLSVVELKNDIDDIATHYSHSDYFIVEPTTPVVESSTNRPNSTQSSIQIIEYFDFSSSSSCQNHFSKTFKDDNINVQSVVSSNINEKMDDAV